MNLEQLNAMSDLELDEAVALAQNGWKDKATEVDDGVLIKEYDVWMFPATLDADGYIEILDTYHPTANTTEGKAQAWDLMVKYELDVSHMRSGNWAVHCHGQALVYGEKPNQLIAIASILSAQENR